MSYFFADLTGLAAATLLAVLLLILPGFGIVSLARRAKVETGRGWSAACWALVTGTALLPALDALLLRWTGMASVLALHVALAVAGARSAFDAARGVPARWWSLPLACFAVVGWANLDFDWNGRLYQPVTILDTVKHAAVISSLASAGAPLHDPFFARPGIAGYYYYFYIGPALLHWLAAPVVSSRAAFAAASFTTLLAFPAMLMLLAQAAGLINEASRRRFFRIVLLLCLVSGLDLLAQAWIWWKTGSVISQLDWWSEEVRWVLTSILWVPHHITAVIAVYTGCLLIAHSDRNSLSLRAVAAGLAFATAFGCSLWIAIAAAPVLGGWWFLDRFKPGGAPAWALPLSAVAALAVAVPQFLDIFSGRSIDGRPLEIYVRPVGPMQPIPHSLGGWVMRLPILPGGYMFEFGIFALGAVVFLMRGPVRQSAATSIGRLLLVGAPLALLMASFVRSAIIYNDFGWRALWFAQVPALLWTACVLSGERKPRASRPVWFALLALGIAAVVWDLAFMRRVPAAFVPAPINEQPAADYDLRRTYEWLDGNLPRTALIQHYPGDSRTFAFGLYSDRPVAVADKEARLFGADEGAIRARRNLLRPIFTRPLPLAEVERRAEAAGVRGVLLSSTDPLWRANGGPPHSWTCAYRSRTTCVMLLAGGR